MENHPICPDCKNQIPEGYNHVCPVKQPGAFDPGFTPIPYTPRFLDPVMGTTPAADRVPPEPDKHIQGAPIVTSSTPEVRPSDMTATEVQIAMRRADQELLRAADSLTIFNCLQRSFLRIEDMIDKKREQEPK